MATKSTRLVGLLHDDEVYTAGGRITWRRSLHGWWAYYMTTKSTRLVGVLHDDEVYKAGGRVR
jgi:hypothetical protein